MLFKKQRLVLLTDDAFHFLSSKNWAIAHKNQKKYVTSNLFIKESYGQTFILFFNVFLFLAGDDTLASFGKCIEEVIVSLESECDPWIGLMKAKLS